jgi:hypothetical protein
MLACTRRLTGTQVPGARWIYLIPSRRQIPEELPTFGGAKHSQTEHSGFVPAGKLSAARKVLVWVCLVIAIEVALGYALQLAAENTVSRADANELAPPIDIPYTPGTCPALDRHVHRALTLDELHDLHDQLCPTLSEPQRTGNG